MEVSLGVSDKDASGSRVVIAEGPLLVGVCSDSDSGSGSGNGSGIRALLCLNMLIVVLEDLFNVSDDMVAFA